MAVYSVFAGEATGGGALLAASALAFGLLAVNIDRVPGQSDPSIEVRPENPSSNGQVDGALPSLDQAIAREEIAVDPLTKREQEVLALVAEGYANKQIGVELGIAERTVVNHITHTIGKLGASDRTHAVVTAIRMGWLDVKLGNSRSPRAKVNLRHVNRGLRRIPPLESCFRLSHPFESWFVSPPLNGD